MKMTCQVKMHAGTATLDTFFEQIFLLNQMNISSTLQQKYGKYGFPFQSSQPWRFFFGAQFEGHKFVSVEVSAMAGKFMTL